MSVTIKIAISWNYLTPGRIVQQKKIALGGVWVWARPGDPSIRSADNIHFFQISSKLHRSFILASEEAGALVYWTTLMRLFAHSPELPPSVLISVRL